MLIAQISDTHISQNGPTDSERLAALGACVEHINQLDRQPSLVIHTGDVVHNGTDAEYAMAAGQLNRLKAKLRVIPGNKDHRSRLHNSLSDACSKLPGGDFLQYVIDHDTVRLICVDTMSELSNKGTLCEARLAHIDQAIGEATKPVMVFMHHPPFEVTTAPEPFQFETREAVTRLAEILSRHKPPLAIFAGHMHRHFETAWNSVPALSMTAGAIDLRKGNELGPLQTKPYYCLHDLSPVGTVSTTLMSAGPAD